MILRVLFGLVLAVGVIPTPAIGVDIEIEESSYISGRASWDDLRAMMITTPHPVGHSTLLVTDGDGFWVHELDWPAAGFRWVRKPSDGSRFAGDALFQTCGAKPSDPEPRWDCDLRSVEGEVVWSTEALPVDWLQDSQALQLTEDRWWILKLSEGQDSRHLSMLLRTGLYGQEPEEHESWTWKVQGADRSHLTYGFPQLAADSDTAYVLAGGQLARFVPGERTFDRRARGEVDQIHDGPGNHVFATVANGQRMARLQPDLRPGPDRVPLPPEDATPGFFVEERQENGKRILHVEPADDDWSPPIH